MESRFVGEWKCDEGDSSARIQISVDVSGIMSVSAYDSNDGEEFELTNLVVSKDAIEFDTRIPSNGYRTHQKLRIRKDGSIGLELTIFERWIKCDPSQLRGEA